MSFDRAEYQRSLKNKRNESEASRVTSIANRAYQAAVSADAVMADPNWRVMQQMVAGTVEKLKAQEDILRDSLCDPLRVNTDDLMRLKLTLAQVVGTRTGLETAIMLPKTLVEDSNKANALLSKLTENQEVDDAAKS